MSDVYRTVSLPKNCENLGIFLHPTQLLNKNNINIQIIICHVVKSGILFPFPILPFCINIIPFRFFLPLRASISFLLIFRGPNQWDLSSFKFISLFRLAHVWFSWQMIHYQVPTPFLLSNKPTTARAIAPYRDTKLSPQRNVRPYWSLLWFLWYLWNKDEIGKRFILLFLRLEEMKRQQSWKDSFKCDWRKSRNERRERRVVRGEC